MRRGNRSKAEYETSEFLAAATRFIRRAGERVGEGDPEDLADLIKLRAVLAAAEKTAVLGIKQRRSWDDIGKALGISREAAYQKWGKK